MDSFIKGTILGLLIGLMCGILLGVSFMILKSDEYTARNELVSQQNELLQQLVENQSHAGDETDQMIPSRVVYPSDLEPGIQVCVENQSDQTSMEYTVVSRVYEMPRGEDKGGMMDVIELRSPDGTESIITLAELGISPYPDGTQHHSKLTFFGTCSNFS